MNKVVFGTALRSGTDQRIAGTITADGQYLKMRFVVRIEWKNHNNISEKDLRLCKNRQKMAGGFRTASGREMYCKIMSFIETVKRRGLNIFQSIIALMNGTPVIQ